MVLSVLVVGAGPVGLTLAAELARQGGHCRLIDQLSEPLPYCRAIGITPRSLEIFAALGLAQPLIDAGVWLEPMATVMDQRWLPAPPEAGSVAEPPPSLGRCGPVPYGDLGVPQPELERQLSRLVQSGGVDLERNVRLDALQPLPPAAAGGPSPGVTVTLLHGDGRREQQTVQVVVGCDGAHSSVRHALAIPFEGEAMEAAFMLGDVAIDWDLPRGVPLRALRLPSEPGPPEFFVAIPLPEPGRYRVSMLAPADLDAAGPTRGDGVAHGLAAGGDGPDLEVLQQVADALLVPPVPRLRDLRWSSTYRISMRLAADYQRGGVFLAGDAAHIHPPTGGQGMNTGIQDAHNLAWKLALVQRGLAPLSLLDSYAAERRPVGAAVIRRTLEASLNFGREQAPPDPLVNTQLLETYRGSAWVRDGEPVPAPEDLRAGDRAPDAEGLRRRHVAMPLRLSELLRAPRHALLISLPAGADPAPARALAARLRQQLPAALLQSHLIALGPPPPECHELAVIADAAGQFAASYGSEPQALLVRPDGHIAWRQLGLLEHPDVPEALREVLGLTFSP
ncbi:pentachlorophenol 4-monooxygenase [Cyanobium sp. PCC 7001]|uniref:FAD-dependent monooxygenase n=1 Tax=Cyanobium sp. PCC 7001 TaxID=180281 RepID=UPI0001804D8B|nr:FAD-dependent monooxygenase [Cyanobium sp. PCC 7001]EDY38869.1 pentachlorophenol 4-monooxygenase [Cyanobium sp. PCC 7001]